MSGWEEFSEVDDLKRRCEVEDLQRGVVEWSGCSVFPEVGVGSAYTPDACFLSPYICPSHSISSFHSFNISIVIFFRTVYAYIIEQ